MSVENIKRQRRAVLVGCLLMCGLFLAVCWMGGSDYDQAVAEQQWYCQMVDEADWPNDPSRHCPDKPKAMASNIASR